MGESESLKIGDLVELKSGSPTMTIESLISKDKVACHWFSGKKLEYGQFHPDSLVRAKANA